MGAATVPCPTVCKKCKQEAFAIGDRMFCKTCNGYLTNRGRPDGSRRWYSPGYCQCGSLLYPFFRGWQSHCRDCNRYIVPERHAKVPPALGELIPLVGQTLAIHEFGHRRWPEEPDASDIGVAIVRDLIRLCLPDIRFLRPDLPLAFYAPWQYEFANEVKPIPQPIMYDRLVDLQTRS